MARRHEPAASRRATLAVVPDVLTRPDGPSISGPVDQQVIVEIGQGVWQVPYQPAVGASRLPVEVLTFAQLRRMNRAGRRTRPQRPAFHVLALIEAGAGRHRADFVDAALVPQTVAWRAPA